MFNNFYLKLAIKNIKSNSRIYIPFIFTFVITVVFVYIFHSICIHPAIDNIIGGQSLESILNTGIWIISIFSVIFLLYTNSFLMKQRNNQIGLYNVLGLGKNHLRKMLLAETLMVFVVGIIVGVSAGIILNKLMFALLLRLLHFEVPFGFNVSVESLEFTLTLFTAIFAFSYLMNVFRISVAYPADLLRGNQFGEKEPKANWLVTMIGFAALFAGYYFALTIENAIQAVTAFFPIAILVMIGTYGIFISGSIFLLKILKRNKKFYYKTENFITVSGLMYRMKQNAVGLANICILSTAVLITLSTTASLYMGMEDVLKERYPREIISEISIESDADVKLANQIINKQIGDSGMIIENYLSFRNISILLINDGDKFLIEEDYSLSNNMLLITLVDQDDYNRYEGTDYDLDTNEVVLITFDKSYQKQEITIEGITFKILEERNTLFGENYSLDITKSYAFVVKDIDECINVIQESVFSISEEEVSEIFNELKKRYIVEFDVDGDDSDVIALSDNINDYLVTSELKDNIKYVENAPANRESFYVLYGGLLFLGIFVGILFLMATVMIIYYKQISEGYDDRERYRIMQNVGLSQKEVKNTIRKQIIMVFFMPLMFAILHLIVAFPILIKVLIVLNLSNWILYLKSTVITVIIFVLIYFVVYTLTAKLYYNVVGSNR